MRGTDLEDLLGPDDADTVMEKCGGRLLYVPARIARSALARRVGKRIAQKIASEYAGETVWFPVKPSERPREQVRALLREGVPPREARRRVGCSNTTMRAALRELKG